MGKGSSLLAGSPATGEAPGVARVEPSSLVAAGAPVADVGGGGGIWYSGHWSVGTSRPVVLSTMRKRPYVVWEIMVTWG